MDSSFAVKISKLCVRFDNFIAVNNISVAVRQGEIFGFLGANGAGKTTTIRVLCGLLRPTAGSVEVGGIAFISEASGQEIKKKVGYMSQKFTLYNDLTIEENLSLAASLRQLTNATYLERLNFILDFISLQHPLTEYVKNLPGGIKQKVSLAAAILHDPEIVFLDEPTAGVTPAARAQFWALIRKLALLGKTIFVSTHYMDEAEQCHRIALMREGQIVALDTPKNLKKSTFPAPLYEFTPKEQDQRLPLLTLRDAPEFEYFEPFGARFHASFKNTSHAHQLKETLSADFTIQAIMPTLEDVFIKIIEGTAE